MSTLKYIVLFFSLLASLSGFSQKQTAWMDTLDLEAKKCRKAVLCGDEMFFTSVDQFPYFKDDSGKKIFFMEALTRYVSEESISGDASMTVEIIVNCKGEAGSLTLIKYGDKKTPQELEMVKALNSAISKIPKLTPAKYEGRVVNYKADKLKVKSSGGKITIQS